MENDKAFQALLDRMQRQRQIETAVIAIAIFMAGAVVGFAFAASVATSF